MVRKDGISVIVCCYNSASRIRQTLDHIFGQDVPTNLCWEVLLIDNNCTDNTVEIATSSFNQSNSNVDFKIISEPKAGLSNARNAGFNNAQYEFVLMVDDDNWLCTDYVSESYSFLKRNEKVGMTGGLGIPKLECLEPNWFEGFAYCFATGHQSKDGESGFVEELYGAGLCLRLSALDELKKIGFKSLLSDRKGSSLMSGGDTELCLVFRMAGWGLYYNANISFQHFLPKNRITWDYMVRLFYGFGQTKSILDIYRSALSETPFPVKNSLPLWLDRALYLSKMFLTDDFLFCSKRIINNLEGSGRVLLAKGKLGQISHILRLRGNYATLYEHVYALNSRLQDGRK